MELHRKRFNGCLEDNGVFRRRVYCDRACMASWMEGRMRVPTVQNSRRQSTKQMLPQCQNCGRDDTRLSVHHLDENPLNNAPSNLRTLCGSCHSLSHSPNFEATSIQRRVCRHCSSPAFRTGLCWTHWSRVKRHGSPCLKKFKIGYAWVLRCTLPNLCGPACPRASQKPAPAPDARPVMETPSLPTLRLGSSRR